MIIDGKDIPPPSEFWVPDYTDFTLPVKYGGNPYIDPDDYEDYLDWLVIHIDSNNYMLNSHHQEIISDKQISDWDAERLGLWIGGGSFSEYYLKVARKTLPMLKKPVLMGILKINVD